MSAILRFLWPFLKEMFLGDKTLTQALRTNKLRLFLLFAIIGSIGMNIWLTPRLFDISTQFIQLKVDHKKLEDDSKEFLGLKALNDQLKQNALDDDKTIDEQQATITSKDTRLTDLIGRNKLLLETNNELAIALARRTPGSASGAVSNPSGPKGTRYDSVRDLLEKMRKEENQ